MRAHIGSASLSPKSSNPGSSPGQAFGGTRSRLVGLAISAAVLASILIGAVGIAWQRHLTSQQHQQAEEQAARGRLRRIEELFARDIGGPALAELAALVRDRPDNRIAAERLVNGLNERAFLLPSSKSFALAPQPWESDTHGDLRAIVENKVDLRVFNLKSGAALFQKATAHEKIIRSVRFSSDGHRLITASGDYTAKVWNLDSGTSPLELKHEAGVNYAEFSPDDAQIVTASRDQIVRVWNAANGQRLAELPHRASVNIARFSPAGQAIVTGTDDGEVRVWHAGIGVPLSEPHRLPEPVEDAYFAPDLIHMVAFSPKLKPYVLRLTSGMVHLPDAPFEPDSGTNNAKLMRDLAGKHSDEIIFVDSSTDGTRIATASADKTARLWDARTLEPFTEPLVHSAAVNCARFSPDGLRLATSTSDQKVRVWDVQSGLPLTDWIQSPDPVASVRFSADGNWVITSAGWKWKLATFRGTPPAWLADFAEAIIAASARSDPISLQKYFAMREMLARAPAADEHAQWASEFMKDESIPTKP